MRIDIIGPTPPPLGGVSVHVSRLHRRLAHEGHRTVIHSPPSGLPVLRSYRRLFVATRGADVVHLHEGGPVTVTMVGLWSYIAGRLSVLTLHSHAFARSLLDGRGASRARTVWAIRQFGAIIAVSEALADDVHALGVPRERIFVAPAFVAPDVSEFRAEAPAPAAAVHFASHHPVLCANAFRNRVIGGELVYGEDLLVDVVAALREEFPNLGLILHVATEAEGDAERLLSIRWRAARLGVDRHIAWILGSAPFGPTLVRSAAMLRPTSTDGDAVSVREALHCGVPALASDRAVRPEGTVVLPYGDVKAWTRAAQHALRSPAPASSHRPTQ